MKNKWSNKAKLIRNLVQAAEMRGYHDMAAKYREKLNQELNREKQKS